MVMIANYQYGWTFFVPDIQKKFGWDRASIQWAFTLFVLFETWLVPVEGWFVDKYGPRIVVLDRRHPLRHRMGDQRPGDLAQRLLSRHDHRRHRRRWRLRHLRRQRAEMVSRQARPRRRHHRRRFRRGLGADGRADPGDDQGLRLPDHLPLFRSRPGHHHRDPRLLPVRAESRTSARGDAERQHHPEPAQLSADRGDPSADLLADVLHVRDRRRRRIDGHRQPQADRRRLEGRQPCRSR